MKRVYIKTYGCQMNERDSEAVAALLRARGYRLADSEAEADVILLNTCSVRDMAEQKALGKMTELAHRKRGAPGLVLGFMGCMAQSRGAALLKKLPEVDLVVGTQRFHHVPDYLDELTGRAGCPQPAVGAATVRRSEGAASHQLLDIAEEPGSESTIKDHVTGTNGDRPVTGFVSIMQGCDMGCTFCIVPATRGPERSRPIPEIVEEVRQLVATGVKEVTLLGQIVTSYGRKKSEFVKLLTAVNDVPGLERLRFTAPHPKGFGDDLVEAYRRLPKLCGHAHLPVQSGSDRILKAMKRGYSRQWYLDVVGKLRAARPGVTISTDIIVGFPGETEEDFQDTMSLVREVEFDQAYIFRYSPRRDTPAAAMPGQLHEEIKERRNQTLLEAVNEVMLKKNQRLVGSAVEILVEGRTQKAGRRMTGRTRGNHIVVFDGSEGDRGRLLPVRIDRATVTTLYGRM